jgi:hypothetical protein
MKKTIGNFVRTALAVVTLAGSQFAMADLSVGNTIQLTDGYAGSQGPFQATVLSGSSMGATFASFCVEVNEHFSYGQTLYVGGISNATVSGISAPGPSQNNDPLSAATEWLFTQYYNNTLAGYSQTAANNDALQNSIWALEDEVQASSLTGNALTWYNAAKTAEAGGWTDKGDNVRVLNLFSNASFTGHAQDQIFMVTAVPEPGTYGMMLVGAGLIGTIARRRRKNKNA